MGDQFQDAQMVTTQTGTMKANQSVLIKKDQNVKMDLCQKCQKVKEKVMKVKEKVMKVKENQCALMVQCQDAQMVTTQTRTMKANQSVQTKKDQNVKMDLCQK